MTTRVLNDIMTEVVHYVQSPEVQEVLRVAEEMRHRDILLAIHYLGAQKALITLTNLLVMFEQGERGAEKGLFTRKSSEEKAAESLVKHDLSPRLLLQEHYAFTRHVGKLAKILRKGNFLMAPKTLHTGALKISDIMTPFSRLHIAAEPITQAATTSVSQTKV